MISFLCEKKDGSSTRFVARDGDIFVAAAETAGNLIVSVSFADEESENRYRDFVLRSTVFVLRDKYPVVKAAFSDKILKSLGFAEKDGGMSADSINITFDNCHGGCVK
ncbi:MAG: hypothetical protein ACLSUT_07920 [Christensenellales bacterium]|jgi:hypothetical protein